MPPCIIQRVSSKRALYTKVPLINVNELMANKQGRCRGPGMWSLISALPRTRHSALIRTALLAPPGAGPALPEPSAAVPGLALNHGIICWKSPSRPSSPSCAQSPARRQPQVPRPGRQWTPPGMGTLNRSGQPLPSLTALPMGELLLMFTLSPVALPQAVPVGRGLPGAQSQR